jgi:hypothetical protein
MLFRPFPSVRWSPVAINRIATRMRSKAPACSSSAPDLSSRHPPLRLDRAPRHVRFPPRHPRPAFGFSVGDSRPLPVLRLPRRCLPAGQRADGPGRLAGRPRHRTGLQPQGRLEPVPRRHGAGLSPAPAPGLRDRDHRPQGADRPFRFAGRAGALRARRRAVAHGGPRRGALGDVSAAAPARCQPAGAVPDLAEPAGTQQDGGAVFHDVLVGHHSTRHAA